jgi:hypothetical protein
LVSHKLDCPNAFSKHSPQGGAGLFHSLSGGQKPMIRPEMARLEDLRTGTLVKGILPDALTELSNAKFRGYDVAEVVLNAHPCPGAGKIAEEIIQQTDPQPVPAAKSLSKSRPACLKVFRTATSLKTRASNSPPKGSKKSGSNI